MTIDVLPPVVWNFVFQVVSAVTIAVILWQVKASDTLDHLRHPREENGVLFTIRRTSKFLMALALCWSVAYAHERSWMIWPPLIAFLLAFNAHMITQILVMRDDIKRRKKFEATYPPGAILGD